MTDKRTVVITGGGKGIGAAGRGRAVAQFANQPTRPVRVAQLANGWIECWDPASERVYYHDPRSGQTRWDLPRTARPGAMALPADRDKAAQAALNL